MKSGWLDWACTADFLAQSAHFWFAWAVTMTVAHFGVPLWILWLAAVPVAGFKEFFIDMRYEDSATWFNQSLDFVFYMLGMVLASCVASLS